MDNPDREVARAVTIEGMAPSDDPAITAVWGPAGAPGRTSVAIALAQELAVAGRRVVLVDADSYGGAVAARLGLPDEASSLAAACRLAERGVLDQAALAALVVPASAPDPFAVLTGIRDAGRWPELSRRRMDAVLTALPSWFDAVVVDCGFNLEADEEIVSDLLAPRRNAATHAALRAADRVVSVVADDAVSVDRCLCARPDLVDLAPMAEHLLVLNRCSGSGEAERLLERFGGLRVVARLPWGAFRPLLRGLVLG